MEIVEDNECTFADDMLILARSAKHLQENLRIKNEAIAKNGM